MRAAERVSYSDETRSYAGTNAVLRCPILPLIDFVEVQMWAGAKSNRRYGYF